MQWDRVPVLSKALIRDGLGAPLLVLVTLAMVVLPLPPLALDFLFTFNIALSLVILLLTVYAMRPLDFSLFPTVLLVATMLRLALNIASTRVVLLNGHTGTDAAGAVIEAFGAFVIGGNYAVGLVVFAILVIINFVVVTKGAGRVSEVSARFTLDAMPGKQMAIDADLNAGVISQEEAKARRAEIMQEADFYGAMDGASKFVRGDAIAGILILFINIIGGLAVGMGQHGLSLAAAVRNYTLLTVGDGLVAQIPSLLLSTATAIIVTRVSTAHDMGEQVQLQLLSNPRALGVTAAVIGALGLVPGMPNATFLLISGGLGWLALRLTRVKETAAAAEEKPAQAPPKPAELSWDDVKPVDVIELEVGYRLIPLVDPERGGALLNRIKGVRRKLSQDLGFLVPPVHVRDNLDLPPTHYRIILLGVPEAEGDVAPDKLLAIDSGRVFGKLDGVDTKDPAFGMPAKWIDPALRDQAQTLGYTVVDPATVVVTHLSAVLQAHAHELFGYPEAQQLLDKLARSAPRLVEELVPKTLPMATVVRVMQNLLEEGIPLTNLRTIAETLAEHAPQSQDPDALTAAVRVALRRLITQRIAGFQGELAVLTLDSELERLLLQSTAKGLDNMVLEPTMMDKLHQALSEWSKRLERQGQPAVLLVHPKLRALLARLFGRTVANLHVLAYNEVAEDRRLRVLGTIGGALPGPAAAA
ncbi:MAG: flagellar biosynthesis protein FlhA [Gammaproteobacteria bacterium]|nr:MAG: flagellar biosynthesis protein FlhA [Gammaproteobacteria bacterium]